MQRQRGELVPIGEVVSDLDGPVQAIRDTSPPARRGCYGRSNPAPPPNAAGRSGHFPPNHLPYNA